MSGIFDQKVGRFWFAIATNWGQLCIVKRIRSFRILIQRIFCASKEWPKFTVTWHSARLGKKLWEGLFVCANYSAEPRTRCWVKIIGTVNWGRVRNDQNLDVFRSTRRSCDQYDPLESLETDSVFEKKFSIYFWFKIRWCKKSVFDLLNLSVRSVDNFQNCNRQGYFTQFWSTHSPAHSKFWSKNQYFRAKIWSYSAEYIAAWLLVRKS